MKPLALYLLKPGAPNCLNILGGGGGGEGAGGWERRSRNLWFSRASNTLGTWKWPFHVGVEQGFPPAALLTFSARLFSGGGHPVRCRMLRSIAELHA